MKIGSGSTVTLGNSLASCPAIAQWVVARHPSSRPASAARNAPLHTLTTRRAPRAAARTHDMSAASRWTAETPIPPGRSNVSQPGSGSGKGWVTNSMPEPVDTGAPSAETSFTS
ncbi:Uncharacterised protein [Mycobacteroides abscessus subsp. abscessus]|nr:Uncharacterised protein [Mycobacteroides abscessus subsp. abscessus]SIN15036.1 Uncharacterised protein [Mycobacteroides abscessus subsp. abscessus]SKZ01085.1 Uncharacterised protein [Mycobacteroides abscessus subsp. abscessus]